MSERRVVITGIGIVTPLGCDLAAFWQSLLAGKSGIGPVTRFDSAGFDCRIGGEARDFTPEKFMPAKEVRRTDRFVHFAVGASRMAVTDAGLELDKYDLNRIGVIVGSGIGGMETIESQAHCLLTKGPARVSPFMIPTLIVNMASGYISMLLGVKGPNLAVVSACATATHAIVQARHDFVADQLALSCSQNRLVVEITRKTDLVADALFEFLQGYVSLRWLLNGGYHVHPQLCHFLMNGGYLGVAVIPRIASPLSYHRKQRFVVWCNQLRKPRR